MVGVIGVIASEVSKVAPLLGSVLGSPAVGVGLSLIASHFGLPVNDAEQLLQAVTNHPETVQEIELKNKAHLDILMDKADARKYGQNYRIFLMVLAIIITAGFFGSLFFLYFVSANINDTEKQLLTLLVGMLASKWQTIIDFFYGASQP